VNTSGKSVKLLLERSSKHKEVRADKEGTPLVVKQLCERLSSVRC
jgi:hypothetical protein